MDICCYHGYFRILVLKYLIVIEIRQFSKYTYANLPFEFTKTSQISVLFLKNNSRSYITSLTKGLNYLSKTS